MLYLFLFLFSSLKYTHNYILLFILIVISHYKLNYLNYKCISPPYILIPHQLCIISHFKQLFLWQHIRLLTKSYKKCKVTANSCSSEIFHNKFLNVLAHFKIIDKPTKHFKPFYIFIFVHTLYAFFNAVFISDCAWGRDKYTGSIHVYYPLAQRLLYPFVYAACMKQ